jgi:hypothetical protein
MTLLRPLFTQFSCSLSRLLARTELKMSRSYDMFQHRWKSRPEISTDMMNTTKKNRPLDMTV